jgi:hypothetical protein
LTFTDPKLASVILGHFWVLKFIFDGENQFVAVASGSIADHMVVATSASFYQLLEYFLNSMIFFNLKVNFHFSSAVRRLRLHRLDHLWILNRPFGLGRPS